MNISKLFSLSILLGLSTLTIAQNNLIPKPQELQINQGFYQLGKTISLKQDANFPEMDYLFKQLTSITNRKVNYQNNRQDIDLVYLAGPIDINEEYYELEIGKNGIEIAAPTNRGIFLGIQTLLQLIEEHKSDLKLPYLKIKDEPKFAYRGMHLDVCRHFFTVDEVKNYLDYLAAYKYNKFHWHLTDDQGWRIEIKNYPKLTEVGAWRKGSQVGAYADMNFDQERYGGYYTQEQIKEVVDYAAKLHIDVIPEIEMPGHAQAAIASYPNLGCTNEQLEVWQMWGVSEIIFCPKEETFTFLEGVLDEVMVLFPYEYIHIGGDEAPKKVWKESAFVQDLLKKLKLKDEMEMQSYFITRIEKYLNSKGRQIIGWDEILEGGLAPNATVMSWTGMEGGIHAAKTNHKAIMTPTSTNYFDYYQGNPETEPLAFGGDTRLKNVYEFNPIPKELNAEQAKYIWGSQGNLWAEYIKDFPHVQHMIFPRLFALSEVVWGTADPKKYDNFEKRVLEHFKVLDRKGIRYSKAIFEVVGTVNVNDGKLFYDLTTAKDKKNIRYTLDRSEPTKDSKNYVGPIEIKHSAIIKAGYFEDGILKSPITKQEFIVTKSTGKRIQLDNQPNEQYALEGAISLVDGVKGNVNIHKKHWLGFSGKDVVATIDLGENETMSNVQFSLINNTNNWIHLPKGAKILVSNDGLNFKEIKAISKDEIYKANGNININFQPQSTRFVKVIVENLGKIPEGNIGAGYDAWLFIDEISIN